MLEKNYNKKWRVNFRKFTDMYKENKINIIAGIAPGLDFNFKQLKEKKKQIKNQI